MKGGVGLLLLKILDQETLGVVKVYVAQTSNERVVVWKAIFYSELSTSHYVFATDFSKCSIHNMATHWYRFGDTCSKTFFNCHKGNHKRV